MLKIRYYSLNVMVSKFRQSQRTEKKQETETDASINKNSTWPLRQPLVVPRQKDCPISVWHAIRLPGNFSFYPPVSLQTNVMELFLSWRRWTVRVWETALSELDDVFHLWEWRAMAGLMKKIESIATHIVLAFCSAGSSDWSARCSVGCSACWSTCSFADSSAGCCEGSSADSSASGCSLIAFGPDWAAFKSLLRFKRLARPETPPDPPVFGLAFGPADGIQNSHSLWRQRGQS